MNIVDELNNEFSKQKLLYKVGQQPVAELEKYKQIAMGYAEMENAVSVLSDHIAQSGLKDVLDGDWFAIILPFPTKEQMDHCSDQAFKKEQYSF